MEAFQSLTSVWTSTANPLVPLPFPSGVSLSEITSGSTTLPKLYTFAIVTGSNIPAGTYNLAVKALDTCGTVGGSASITITVPVPPNTCLPPTVDPPVITCNAAAICDGGNSYTLTAIVRNTVGFPTKLVTATLDNLGGLPAGITISKDPGSLTTTTSTVKVIINQKAVIPGASPHTIWLGLLDSSKT